MKSKRLVSSYWSWVAMKQRCDNPNTSRWKHYGGRGISYPLKWKTFEGFYVDMGERPSGLSLERLNVHANYSSENCTWATNSEQGFNQTKRSTNKSGRTGVSKHSKVDMWDCRICHQGVIHYLGLFTSFEEACMIREAAELEFFGRIKE